MAGALVYPALIITGLAWTPYMSDNSVSSLATFYPVWPDLQEHIATLEKNTLKGLFQQKPDRSAVFSCSAAGIELDFSRNLITEDTLGLLEQLCSEMKLDIAVEALFGGASVNSTEQRAALHTALRSPDCNTDEEKLVHTTLERLEQLTQQIHSGDWKGHTGKAITDIVNIGIGGSHLGPRMACRALQMHSQHKIRNHFVSNIDPFDIHSVLQTVTPESTLIIVASKTFTTLETLANAHTARDWLVDALGEQATGSHFLAVTSAIPEAGAFGINADNCFPIWDWVGGRYSLWSAIGLSIMLEVGVENFRLFLAGAHEMDQHFKTAPPAENMPVILALLNIIYSQLCHAKTSAVLPYKQQLEYLPEFLQQLEMESNGKSVTSDGQLVNFPTGSILWGAAGTNGQHSFHQLLHQGTHLIPTDFIFTLQPDLDQPWQQQQHLHLVANCLSQSQALLEGKDLETVKQAMKAGGYSEQDIEQLAPHRVHPGNRPSNLISMDRLTPATLGALLALYEHRTFVQSLVWKTNAFDQFGVELGKELGRELHPKLSGEDNTAPSDKTTGNHIARFRKANGISENK
jgi:glucose-6-phosphate isomerase